MENKDKKQKLLTIIGVVALLASIIGLTYAYFSATVSSTGANIAGTTNADFASNLSITVTRINKTPTNASSINLVPSNITADTTSITRAISHNCEADGYTGCHLYQITATTNSAISHANIYLDSLTVSGAAQDKSSWKYAVFTGTTTSATNIVTSGSFEVTTPGTIDIHNNASLASTVTYYLLIYIANDTSNSQNSNDSHDVTGVYNGTVSMSAAGGKVSALFNSNSSSSALPDFILNSNAPLDSVNSTYVTGRYEEYTISSADKETLKPYMVNDYGYSSSEADECLADANCWKESWLFYNEANDPDIELIGTGNLVPGIDFRYPSSDTNGKGIYIRRGTENNINPIYYYRGAVENNNVYFANYCWKIVRTTDTGGLKMIFNGTPTSGTCGSGVESQSNSTIGDSAFNANYNDAKYVGYTYDNSGVETDSTIKGVIDTWYQTNMLANYDNYIEDTVYCNDREEVTAQEKTQIETAWDYTYDKLYKSISRVMNTTPSLTCTNNADKYTKSSSLGNGKLTYPVGLLTMDEIWIAGVGLERLNGSWVSPTSYYLDNGNLWWSLSPNDFGNCNAAVWYAHPWGGLDFNLVLNSLHGARPALSLKPGQNFEYGNGSENNPYRFVATVPNG